MKFCGISPWCTENVGRRFRNASLNIQLPDKRHAINPKCLVLLVNTVLLEKTPNGSKIGTSVNILLSFENQDCVGHIGAMKRTWACSRWIFCKHLEMTLKGGNKYGLTNIPHFAVKASINSASGSGFQEQNLLHWLFQREANKSISKGPNFLESSRKITGESCHSVFSSRILLALSAKVLSEPGKCPTVP